MTGEVHRRLAGPVGAWAHYTDGFSDDFYERAREAAVTAHLEDPPECRADEVDFELAWQRGATGMLTGDLIAANVSKGARRLSGKPGLRLIGIDGLPTTAATASRQKGA